MDHLKNHVYSHVNRVRPGIPKHNMSTFVRSSTSRSSLRHRLFTMPDQENDIDDEEDDEEFEQFIKNSQEAINEVITMKNSEQSEDAEMPPDVDWSSRAALTCRVCHKECDGFHMAASHMKHIHPVSDVNATEQGNNFNF